MKHLKRILAGVLIFGSLAGLTAAQRGGGYGGGLGGGGGGGGGGFGRGGFGRGGRVPDFSDRRGIPDWPVDPAFKNDQFTFVRIIYDNVKYDADHRSGGFWWTDSPDSDYNVSFRLQQMTSLKVNPHPVQIRLTDPSLFDYPFIYMLEIGHLQFRDEEIPILRRYLLNGGFLMVDDHWGLNEQANWREELKRVFPESQYDPVELKLDHPIFHCVFDLKAKPQIPGIELWRRWQTTGEPDRTWERLDDTQSHYRGTFDSKGRMMVFECANTDLGDGWEREGADETYFHKFSEKQAYPMCINIVFYAMTH